ncbi:PiggyBac transposable element-derived protein 4 [Anthophora plagiata]
MTRRQHLTEAEELNVVEARKIIDMAKVFSVNRCIITKIIKQFDEYGTVKTAPRTGRPRKTTEKLHRRITRLSKSNPFYTASEIKNQLDVEDVSKKNRVARLRFAKEHLNRTATEWSKILWSDEKNHPKIINVQNKHGIWTKKPIEVVNYNANMSGIDRCDQMIYYSSPKKSIRWYKKVIFRLLEISVWNSYYIYKKINDSNIGFLDFRDKFINTLLKIPQNSNGRNFVLENANPQTHVRYNPTTDFRDVHYQEKIPAPPNYKRKTYFLKCKYCYRQKIIKFTSHRCQDCTNKPPLCLGQCFRQWHLPPADQNNSNSSDMES